MGYWRYVRRRAYLEARDYVRDHFGRAMTFVAVSLIAVAAVRIYGAEGEWANDLIAVVAWVGAMALVFGYLFVVRMFSVPVKMRKAMLAAVRRTRTEKATQAEEIARLSAKPDKVLRFRWSPIAYSPMHAFDLLVHLTNESGQTIDGVEVELFYVRDLRYPMGMPVSFALVSVEGGRSVSLHPRQTKAFRLAHIPHSMFPDSGHRESIVVSPGTPMEQRRPRADYAFSVRATGRDVADPDEAVYQLNFSETGYGFGPEQAQADVPREVP